MVRKVFFHYAFIYLLLIGFSDASASSILIDTWKGDWGNWEKQNDREHPYYVGGQISIYDCSADSICSFIYKSQKKPKKRSSIYYESCSGEGKINLLSTSKAIAVNEDSANLCKTYLELDSKNDVPVIIANQEGEKCDQYYCTNSDVFATHYPLITRDQIIRKYDQRCYYNPSITLNIRCRSDKIDQLMTEVEMLKIKLDTLKGSYKSPKKFSYFDWTEKRVFKCDSDNNPENCMLVTLKSDISALNKEYVEEEILYEKDGNTEEAKSLFKKIEGSYIRDVAVDFLVDGFTQTATNKLEISKGETEDKINFFAELWFTNGHQCYISGAANYKKIKGFVFQDPSESEKCYFTIRLKGNTLIFTTPKGDCSTRFCGYRGNLNGNYFTLKNKIKKKK